MGQVLEYLGSQDQIEGRVWKTERVEARTDGERLGLAQGHDREIDAHDAPSPWEAIRRDGIAAPDVQQIVRTVRDVAQHVVMPQGVVCRIFVRKAGLVFGVVVGAVKH